MGQTFCWSLKVKIWKSALDDTSAFSKLNRHLNLEYIGNWCFYLLSSNTGPMFLLTTWPQISCLLPQNLFAVLWNGDNRKSQWHHIHTHKNLAACFNSESAQCLSKGKPKHVRSVLLWACSGKQSSDGGALTPQRGIPGPPGSCPLHTAFPAAFISQPRLSACALSSDKLQPWHCLPTPSPSVKSWPTTWHSLRATFLRSGWLLASLRRLWDPPGLGA